MTKESRYLEEPTVPDAPRDAEELGAVGPSAGSTAGPGPNGLAAVTVPAFKALFTLLCASVLLFLSLNLLAADPALAQQDGGGAAGGERIEGTIVAARDFISTLMVSLGGLGFVCGVAVKAVARTNENMHHASHMAMTGSGIAVVAGILAPDVIDLVSSWAGGTGQ